MFVIITYDVDEKRVYKVHKILKKYLVWTQNSVFEGKLSEGKLKKCLTEIRKVIDEESDSIYLYKVMNSKQMKKIILGQEKSFESIFL